MSLPVRHVITTNYDDLLERALIGLKRHPVKVIRQEDVARMRWSDGVHVVKLHGDASEAEGSSCAGMITMSSSTPAGDGAAAGGLLLNTFFFVGYGLRDPNFRQVYSRIGACLRDGQKPAFATSSNLRATRGSVHHPAMAREATSLGRDPGFVAGPRPGEPVRFLDRLANRVASRRLSSSWRAMSRYRLTLRRVRELMQEVGKELITLARGMETQPVSCKDVHDLAEILGFLAEHGWRPPQASRALLSELWLRLTSSSPDPRERQRLLIAALRTAEGFAEVDVIRRQLAALRDH